jgi:hypothetical protein
VAGVVGLDTLGGRLGWGDPEVDDCVQMQGATSSDVVDRGSSEAEYRVVGIEDEQMNHPAFMADRGRRPVAPAPRPQPLLPPVSRGGRAQPLLPPGSRG